VRRPKLGDAHGPAQEPARARLVTTDLRRLDEPVAGRTAALGSPRKKKVTSQPPGAEAADTPACSKAQNARRLGAEGRLVKRSVGLGLGARHIAYWEVRNGMVVDRANVKKLEQLKSRIGPGTAPARIAFDASREGWHVHDTLVAWGHEPKMNDSTRMARRRVVTGFPSHRNLPRRNVGLLARGSARNPTISTPRCWMRAAAGRTGGTGAVCLHVGV
jgi:hypothetical protein